ncbi:MAG: bacteriohemerythrin [Treponema sp.]|jgi:hemerythrin|nr:bacteriohemerythrin [Treponema sp.]
MNVDSVTWDDAYSVGFEPMDNQHKELVKMINELFEACKQGTAAADKVFLQTIKKAVEYARNHFSEEEKYMLQADFPNLSEQRKQHDDFVASVLKSMQDYKAGDTAGIEMARFLKDWLLNHIAISDKQYAPYMAKL